MTIRPDGAPRQSIALMVFGLLAVFWAQFAWVRPTNLGGTDDWLIVDLTSRGIVDFPYANRPLNLIWNMPAALIAPHRLGAHFLVHTAYLALSGLLVFALGRRLLPRQPVTVWLTAAFMLVWAPLDRSRPCALAPYAGATFGTLGALALLVEAYARGRRALFGLAAFAAVVTARSYEGTLPLLAGVPPLLVAFMPARPRRLWWWLVAWESVIAAAAALVVWPVLFSTGEVSYQLSGLGLDLGPLRVVARLWGLFSFHVQPLWGSPLRELSVTAVPVSVAVFALAYSVATRRTPPPGGPEARPGLWAAMAAGGAIAGLGYSLFTASAGAITPARTQFLAGPGIALLLAAGISLMASLLPVRWRNGAAVLLGAWVVAVGAGRTKALQAELDRQGSYAKQRNLLAELTRRAPSLAPNTLVVLLDGEWAFPANFTFRPAIEYLYPGQATGYVWGASDFLFPARFTPEGVWYEPWPVIRKPWGARPSFHRYDELIVVYAAGGQVHVLSRWPERGLPPLPPGAGYNPAARIMATEPLPSARRILEP